VLIPQGLSRAGFDSDGHQEFEFRAGSS
jgi:hypothetical protein